jgi:hypothetical protein
MGSEKNTKTAEESNAELDFVELSSLLGETAHFDIERCDPPGVGGDHYTLPL